ncbi:5-formyltetrahydrofolate cyclo-ligase [Leucobacter sp. USCH14]|uniref:5-formyltetrahydrofolate cyclo-ligase n=1 Tax=Leucobacter sp. USCH14 TaxID=3024838 RepID=UPI003099452C
MRSSVRTRRIAVSAEDRERRRAGFTEHLTALVAESGAQSISAYVPLGNEPDVSGFLEWSRETGLRVLLPVSLPGHRIEWAVDTGARVEGRHGIAEPEGPRFGTEAAADLDLLIVPACAVDATGTRLGWGLGYYDRMLGSLRRRPPVYAVVDDEDVYPTLPRDAHDVPVTGAVTSTRILRFADLA